jgi:dihydroorotate dehydrogenase
MHTMNGYRFVRPVLFQLDSENVHERAIAGLRLASRSAALLGLMRRMYRFDDPRLRVQLFGRDLDNPLGVAAGFDKNGVTLPALAALGFGFVEVGTVTPQPQVGNQRPRIFRLKEDRALINRMGLPGVGVEAVAQNLTQATSGGCFGLNVGPNKDRVLQTDEDVALVIQRLARFRPAYFVVNVSSPNTAQLRDLQGKEALHRLLSSVLAQRPQWPDAAPILVKIAPDLSERELDDILQVVTDLQIPGIVATNTTTSRPASLRSPNRAETGGLSGLPLRPLADQVIRRIYQQTQGQVTIIAAGGVFTGRDVISKIGAGATVVQAYTGFVYRGPAMALRVKQELARYLDHHGIASIQDLRGTGASA